jgi:virginiamycin B lyase
MEPTAGLATSVSLCERVPGLVSAGVGRPQKMAIQSEVGGTLQNSGMKAMARRSVLCAVAAFGAWLAAAQMPETGQKATGVRDVRVQRQMTDMRPLATFRVGSDPDWMAVAEDAVWVTVDQRNAVVRLDARANRMGGEVTVAKPCSGLAVGFRSLWVPSCGEHALTRVDLKTRKVVAKIPVGPADSEGGIAVGAGSLWMVSDEKALAGSLLVRVDPSTNQVVARIAIPEKSCAAVIASGSVWGRRRGKTW